MPIRIEDIAYVRHAVPDLERMAQFLADFGLTPIKGADGRLYAAGTDPAPFAYAAERGEPALAAIGLRAASLRDLEALAAAEGVGIVEAGSPGGGRLLSLIDPDGHRIEVIAGQAGKPATTTRISEAVNDASRKARIGRALRLAPGPSHVARIGHCVVPVSDFERAFHWYRNRFGFIASDIFSFEPGRPVGAFLRCDRGATPTDHHTLALVPGNPAAGVLHTAFEVADIDDLMLGHAHLASSGGYTHVRGVGRHILGSQVFDYWSDPWGNEFEHWTDGDLFTAADPRDCPRTLADLIGTQWGKGQSPG
ncbi:MAG: VOC family protein [Gammaproteobacteria bacterium]